MMRDERRILLRKRKRRRVQLLLLQAFLCAGSWRICAGQDGTTGAPSQTTRNETSPPSIISPESPESLPNQLNPTPAQTSSPSTSVKPSSLPSSNAPITSSPTDQPSQAPTFRPTASQPPSLIPSNAPSPVPSTTFLPSSMPSTSSQPTDSAEPSGSPVPPSDVPSVVPSDTLSTLLPSSLPTLLPTFVPSERPSMSPSQTREIVNYPFIEMVLQGVENNFSQATFNSFALITSQHVQDFWNNQLQNSPVEVGDVQTGSPLQQQRLSRNETEFVGPLWVSYNQTIRYSRTEYHQPNLNLSTQLFLLPFQLNPYPYTQALQNATNNTLPIVIARMRLGNPPPTPAPTPAEELIEKQRKNDNRIIIITVVITGVSLLVAGGYIIYLTRKEEEGGSTSGGYGMSSTRHTNYNDDHGGVEDDFYRATSGGGARIRANSSAAAMMMDDDYDDDGVPMMMQSSTYHSFQSDTIASESNGMIPTVPLPATTTDGSESTTTMTGREGGSDRGGGGGVVVGGGGESYAGAGTTSTLPISVINDVRLDSGETTNRRGGRTAVPSLPQGGGDLSDSYEAVSTLARDDTNTDRTDDDEIEPVPPLMTGFQLQIEDLDDMSE